MKNSNNSNIILASDSYKFTQWPMYPEGIQKVSSYFEARDNAEYNQTVFFGLQYYLKKYLAGQVVTREFIDEAADFAKGHFGFDGVFNRAGWEYILEEHDGYLPIEIRAVAEGTVVDNSNALMTVVNTDDNCAWLTNYLETILSQIWYTCTVASASYEANVIIKQYLKDSADSLDGLPFMLHDFGYRGCTSQEAAALGSSAHLINFKGSDTPAAFSLLRDYYSQKNMPMFSVVATEHSVMTAEGPEGEFKIVDRLLTMFPSGVLSVVSDSYDIYNACREYGTTFKERILNRAGVFVVRPDSGNPVSVSLACLEILAENFGTTLNSKGYKVLPSQIRVLWGDGIVNRDVNKILEALNEYGWSAENIVFGMGGGLLQKCNRDTQRFAFKCSAQKVNNEWKDVYKNPMHGGKASKKGQLSLVQHEGIFKTVPLGSAPESSDLLIPVFRNGKILKEYTFEEIRENVKY